MTVTKLISYGNNKHLKINTKPLRQTSQEFEQIQYLLVKTK